ncbi:MAG: choice-of-anchor D domain-containing protein, partial [bacterium]|nr:choice-of-anchor D domain-containing protein [Candidatus Kapabacteria bacterium]
MRPILILVAALMFCAAWTNASAQVGEKSRPNLMGSNSEGFHFMIGFMQNEIDECGWEHADLMISLASRFDARVTIVYPDPDHKPLDTVVKAYSVVEVHVPPDYEMYNEGLFHFGIEVKSDRPISVTSYNSKITTSDGYLALPVSSWGTQYIAACYYVDQYVNPVPKLCDDVPRRGEFAVIAAEDDTWISISPSTRTLGDSVNRAGMRQGQVYRRLLNKGDIFQVQDGGNLKPDPFYPGTDLTGSTVTSTKPVGLISGHMRTGVTTEFNTKDHLVEMIPPRNTLGKRYMVVPFGGRTGGDVVRVISTTATITNVTITSTAMGQTSTRLISTGDFYDYYNIDPIQIVADQPVLVVHYSRSQHGGVVPGAPSSMFDPDMVVVTPQEQFVNGAVFQTLDNTAKGFPKFLHHYVALVGERATFDKTLLNKRTIDSYNGRTRGDFAGTPYSWAVIEVPDNMTHVIESEGLFGGYVYGVGNVDSYAWPIGSGLRQFDLVDSDPPLMRSRPVCGAAEIIAVDSGRTQLGLANVWLDTTVSTNAVFDKTMVVIGDELSLGYVRQLDPKFEAFGRVWAEDLAGQRTSIDVRITVTAPRFSHDSISFGYVFEGQTARRDLTIHNDSGMPITVDSVVLQRGREFVLDRFARGIVLNSAGGNATLTVRYMTTTRSTNRDTLIITADCRKYRIPLVAYGAEPKIMTHALDFGPVRVGKSKVMSIIVSSTGDAPLRIDSATIEGLTFAKGPRELKWPVTIEPGKDTIALEVNFRPTATRDFAGLVRFYSNADTIALSPLTGRGIYPALSISGHDFGRVQLGDTACTLIRVLNIGSDTAYLRSIDLPNPEAFIPDQRVFVDPSDASKPYPLGPGDSLMVPVCFAPTEEKPYLSDVSPRNDDDVSAMNSIRGSGYRLRATLGGADLGSHWIGTSKDSTVFVTNVGTDPITITRIWLGAGDSSDFRIDTLEQAITLAAGAKHPINVHFSPIVEGDRVITIHAQTASNHQAQLDSVLVGFGLFAMSSDELLFDDKLAYACGDRSGRIVIRNLGNTPLTIASITHESQPSSMVVNAPSPGYSIPIGESLELDFTLDFAGYNGTTRCSVSWTFEEPPNVMTPRTFTRDFAIESSQQKYYMRATAPPRVDAAKTFELNVRIDSAAWADVAEREL